MDSARGVDVLVFSRDRAAQLDLLLRSIGEYAGRLYRSVSVLWTASDRCYREGYNRCSSLHHEVLWSYERDFELDVRRWLSGRLAHRDEDAPLSFLVDDDVFYRDAPSPRMLRLPWSLRGGDYDYPFSVDGNVYRVGDVCRLLYGLRFRDPSELEAAGHEQRRRLPFGELNHGIPCLVGLPLNRVSEHSRMPHLGVHQFELNERFLAGERLRLPDLPAVIGAHAMLEPRFS